MIAELNRVNDLFMSKTFYQHEEKHKTKMTNQLWIYTYK